MLTSDPMPTGLATLAVWLHRAKLLFNFVFNGLFLVVLVWALARRTGVLPAATGAGR
jgi:hypothetical protein